MTACISPNYFRDSFLQSTSFASSDPYETRRSTYDSEKSRTGFAASTLQSQAHAVLASVKLECSEEGWDGYTAKPISSTTFGRVSEFLNELPCWMQAPEIIPENDGEISIDWYISPDRVFSISIGESGPLHFAGRFGRDKERHGTEAFDGRISEEILSYIKRLF